MPSKLYCQHGPCDGLGRGGGDYGGKRKDLCVQKKKAGV